MVLGSLPCLACTSGATMWTCDPGLNITSYSPSHSNWSGDSSKDQFKKKKEEIKDFFLNKAAGKIILSGEVAIKLWHGAATWEAWEMGPPSRDEAMRGREGNMERVCLMVSRSKGLSWHYPAAILLIPWATLRFFTKASFFSFFFFFLFYISQFVLGFLSLSTQGLDEQKHSDKLSSLPYMFETSKMWSSVCVRTECLPIFSPSECWIIWWSPWLLYFPAPPSLYDSG